MTLNKGQQDASDQFDAFMLDPNEQEMVLTGPPGCGKSYLIANLVDRFHNYQKVVGLLSKSSMLDKIVLTATTNKAAEVLSQATGAEAVTIHSFLGLVLKKNFSTGEMYLSKTINYSVKENILLIIDEASMIDSHLLDIIRKSTFKSKIIYVGDKNQLGPVKEPTPPVFNQNLKTVELTQPMRFQGPIELLCKKLNHGVETVSFHFIQHVLDHIEHLDAQDAQNKIEELFDLDKYSVNSSKILTYTNKQAMAYNAFIREQVQGLPAEYQIGEYVICNNAVKEIMSKPLMHPTIKVDSVWKITNIFSPTTWMDIPCIPLQLNTTTKTRIPLDWNDVDNIMKAHAKSKNWPNYFAVKEGFADLRSTFSSTVHKSQGSTYENVFINLTDLGSCRNPAVFARLLNVACSRASNKIYLIGDLPTKYKGE